MRLRSALLGLALSLPATLLAGPFRPITAPAEAARLTAPRARAAAVRAFAYDATLLAETLRDVAVERPDAVGAPSTLLELPHPDGGLVRFRVIESPVVAPELAAKYPDVRTYRGEGVDDPTASVRFDVSPRGFSAMVLSALGAWYVEPWSAEDPGVVASYHRRDARRDPESPFVCRGPVKGRPEEPSFRSVRNEAGPTEMPHAAAVGATLKTYKLALATTGEYAVAVCGASPTKACVHTELVAAVNRVVGIYERELAIRMTLVANNDDLIYLNAATDPYTNDDGGTMLGENQTTVDSVIGTANYDIGHVFSTGGGGIAMLEAVCWTGYKAQGVTGSPAPTGDAFWVDYVAHEMGHEFGANHTFDSKVGSCGGGNRNDGTAYEPGSGTTIMAYAGICGTEDLQPHSDPYFHAVSFDEIVAYTSNTAVDYGGYCPTSIATGNSAPTAEAGAAYTIPSRTPFALTGSATDPNADALTYGWEEFDLSASGTGTSGPPLTDDGSRPIFRSFNPTSSPTRVFPQLSDVLAGTTTYGETLPTTSRTMTFRLTARDNRAGGGGVASDTTTVTSVAAAGPFAITAPAAAVSWAGSSSQTVTWNVAGTASAPISCANVAIALSTDGGLTFPTTLLASTPNDGSQAVTLPSTPTTTARIRVSCVGNVFFAISRPSFTITAAPAPTVSSISPTSGTTAGGTAVTIAGTGFVSGATVAIGGVAATSVVVGSATSITAVTGARVAGTVDVVVTNPDTTWGTKASAYTYVAGSGSSSLRYFPVTPCRIVDTRTTPDGPLAGPALAASPAERTFAIVPGCGVPAEARVVSANVTVTEGAAAGSLRLFPSDASLPVSTTISFGAGKTRANNAMLLVSAAGGAGRVTVRNDAAGTVHLVLDVNGYFK